MSYEYKVIRKNIKADIENYSILKIHRLGIGIDLKWILDTVLFYDLPLKLKKDIKYFYIKYDLTVFLTIFI